MGGGDGRGDGGAEEGICGGGGEGVDVDEVEEVVRRVSEGEGGVVGVGLGVRDGMGGSLEEMGEV